jgi:O-antigen/teichoic acid export membrane protein
MISIMRKRHLETSSILRQFAGVFSVDALMKASGMLLLPLYLILMTQEEYATFNYLTAVIGVLSQVCTFGLYVPQSKIFHDVTENERGTLLLTISSLLIGLLSLTLLPTYLFGWDSILVRFLFSGNIDYERYRYMIPAGVVLAVFSNMLLNYFLTRQQIRDAIRYNISRLIMGAAFTMGALYWIVRDGASVRLVSSLGAELVAFMAFSIHYIREMHGRFNPQLARRTLALGLPIMGSAILGIAINFGDKFFLERFCSLPDMSVYFLGLTFSSAISVVFMAFQNVWLPRFLKEKDLATNLARTRSIFGSLLLLLGILAVLIWLMAAGAFHFGFINQVYIRVLSILPILMTASICSCLVGLLSVYTVYWEMTYVTVFTGVVIAIIGLPLNYFVAKDYGIGGIASVSVLLNVLYGLFYYAFIRYRTSALISRDN